MITNRDFGHEYAELKKKKIPGSLNLGVTLRDKRGCIITEWVQKFDIRKGGIVDGIQIYVLDGHFLCFLTEETVQLAAEEDRKDKVHPVTISKEEIRKAAASHDKVSDMIWNIIQSLYEKGSDEEEALEDEN